MTSEVQNSRGYEDVADAFMACRAETGATAVRAWVAALEPGAAVLDLGCGHGLPIMRELVAAGMVVYGVDASPSLVDACLARFPEVTVECATVEASSFFGRKFDGVVAWGLMFLLSPAVQAAIIRNVAAALNPGGRFLFTAPTLECEWTDSLTGQVSHSLGAAEYRRILQDAGFRLTAEFDDEGDNHYYVAVRSEEGRNRERKTSM